MHAFGVAMFVCGKDSMIRIYTDLVVIVTTQVQKVAVQLKQKSATIFHTTAPEYLHFVHFSGHKPQNLRSCSLPWKYMEVCLHLAFQPENTSPRF